MDAPHYESTVWRPVSPPKRVRIDLYRVVPALFLGSVGAAPPVIRSTGLRPTEPAPIGELHTWIRTNRGVWIGRCVVQAQVGQSHTVLLDVYAPADAIHPEPTPTGRPNTQLAISSGASAYYYEYDADGNGILRCCPDGQVAHADADGRVRCGHKGEVH